MKQAERCWRPLGAGPGTQPGGWARHSVLVGRTPTPLPLAFSCRNFRNLVRKMYLEASPFRGRKNETVMR